jgi:hypothetical protein
MSAGDRPHDLLQIELPGVARFEENAPCARDVDPLNRIRIASPCDASWEEMEGDDLVRYCRHCRLNVYNLSGLSRREAAAFVRETEGRLCVRFYRRADGTLLTDNCPVGWRAARRWLLERIGSSVAVALGLAGLVAPVIGQRREMGRTISSLDHLKQLALAFLMYTQDYDGRLPPMEDPVAMKRALLPYVKWEAAFVHPISDEPYQPNSSLSQRVLASIAEPETVVACYEAHPTTPETRGVVFLDGSAKRVPEADWPDRKRASGIP